MKGKIVKIGLSLALGVTLSLAVAACGGGSAETSSDHSAVTAHGRMLTIGSGEPQVLLGEEGDICLVAETGLLYRKSSNGWAEAAYESYNAENDIFTVNYSNGAVETYEMTVLPSECKHENLSDPVTVYDSKCVIPGIGVRYCTDCGEAFPAVLPANGEHSYTEKSYVCTVCGETDYFKDGTVSEGDTAHPEGYFVVQKVPAEVIEDGVLEIPGHIHGLPVVIGEKAFQGNSAITDVILDEDVVKIEANAFARCKNLKSIEFPETLTEIGASAFSSCDGLDEIDLSNTSVTEIGHNAFTSCRGVTTLKLPETLETIGNSAFYDLREAETLVIPKSVKTIGTWAFSGNRTDKDQHSAGFTSVTIEEGSELTTIGTGAFERCQKLKSFDLSPATKLSGYISSSDIDDGQIFRYCDQLETVKLPAMEEIWENMFNKCTGLKNIEYADPASVLRIGARAFGETALEKFDMPNALQEIGENVFNNTPMMNNTENWTPVYNGNGEEKWKALYLEGVMVRLTMNEGTEVLNFNVYSGGTPEQREQYGNDPAYTLVLPQRIRTVAPYFSSPSYYEKTRSTYAKVIIPATMERLPEKAFGYFSSDGVVSPAVRYLSVVEIEDTEENPSHLVSIGAFAFSSATIDKINIPDSVKHIGEGAFQNNMLPKTSKSENVNDENGKRLYQIINFMINTTNIKVSENGWRTKDKSAEELQQGHQNPTPDTSERQWFCWFKNEDHELISEFWLSLYTGVELWRD